MLDDDYELDEIDRQIIEIVEENPNISHTDIAEKVERSQPTIGMRIQKLKENGILQFQAGLNLKVADMIYARVEIQTEKPKELLEEVRGCPYILNAFRLSGKINVSVLMANSRIAHLDDIVNHFFRDNPKVKKASMNIITEIVNDFVLPIDLDFTSCECDLKDMCNNS
ncbi:MAG: winged helix-turn-helix transcriptional regulator [Candidatus Lokiarchaeota archaeon]|nr:winged helix-turn-helix transcriptional regulator [Candidatus Lokiarchaeota archaeon]MBD3199191.1 winged helix-turn-helix transcriptional regulator [Candidatus Lokiarchaeota archaeon]